MDWRIQTPARLELLGPSYAGKSTLLLLLVEDDSVWDHPFTKVLYAAPMISDREEYLTEMRERCERTAKQLCVMEKIPSKEELQDYAEGDPLLLIADDVFGFPDATNMAKIFFMWSHHLNISCVFCVQSPFYKNAKLDLTTVSRNLTGRFILWQTGDFLQYNLVSNRLFPDKKGFLLQCLTEAKEKYGQNYVFCNVHPFSNMTRRYMVCTALFKDQRAHHHDSPVFFDLEKRA